MWGSDQGSCDGDGKFSLLLRGGQTTTLDEFLELGDGEAGAGFDVELGKLSDFLLRALAQFLREDPLKEPSGLGWHGLTDCVTCLNAKF